MASTNLNYFQLGILHERILLTAVDTEHGPFLKAYEKCSSCFASWNATTCTLNVYTHHFHPHQIMVSPLLIQICGFLNLQKLQNMNISYSCFCCFEIVLAVKLSFLHSSLSIQ